MTTDNELCPGINIERGIKLQQSVRRKPKKEFREFQGLYTLLFSDANS